ncbi:hypothetical protein GCM10012285_67130 [Streptomyces kronopolitis]|uniref:Uncharacterized protein n=1 Tax=Streptomyces kronopolitis TaxID=1612435 RepID=A0ABQ2K3W3_9ACTN|nr:hypothetical protein GCM10012285_67130 [Streptomyces kronopolitis]
MFTSAQPQLKRQPEPNSHPYAQDTAVLRLPRPSGEAEPEAGFDEGWINGAILGDSKALWPGSRSTGPTSPGSPGSIT